MLMPHGRSRATRQLVNRCETADWTWRPVQVQCMGGGHDDAK